MAMAAVGGLAAGGSATRTVDTLLTLGCIGQVGQATIIYHWAFEDGTEGGPAAFVHVEPGERPSDEEVHKAGLPQFPPCGAHPTQLASMIKSQKHSHRICNNACHAWYTQLGLGSVPMQQVYGCGSVCQLWTSVKVRCLPLEGLCETFSRAGNALPSNEPGGAATLTGYASM